MTGEMERGREILTRRLRSTRIVCERPIRLANCHVTMLEHPATAVMIVWRRSQ
jgi:hypothetical protein